MRGLGNEQYDAQWEIPFHMTEYKKLERFLEENCAPEQLSPLTLAFVGDGVYDLMVRERLVCQANRQAGKLHKLAVEQVKCQAQAQRMEKILPLLTEEEQSVYKRGRNAHTTHTPKNATSADYHSATGMEALFGYLYLKGRLKRLRELFVLMCQE